MGISWGRYGWQVATSSSRDARDRSNGIFYRDLQQPGGGGRLLRDFDADYTFIDNLGSTFLFQTDRPAKRSRPQRRAATNSAREIVQNQGHASTTWSVESSSALTFRMRLRRALFRAAGARHRATDQEIALPSLGSDGWRQAVGYGNLYNSQASPRQNGFSWTSPRESSLFKRRRSVLTARIRDTTGLRHQ